MLRNAFIIDMLLKFCNREIREDVGSYQRPKVAFDIIFALKVHICDNLNLEIIYNLNPKTTFRKL